MSAILEWAIILAIAMDYFSDGELPLGSGQPKIP
jgi:hypothetical protein